MRVEQHNESVADDDLTPMLMWEIDLQEGIFPVFLDPRSDEKLGKSDWIRVLARATALIASIAVWVALIRLVLRVLR